MGDDGIVRVQYIGDIDRDGAEAFADYLAPHFAAASEKNLVKVIAFSGSEEKYRSGARQKFAEINREPMLGAVAVVGTNRTTRVMATLILKATGRDNIRFFDEESDAVAWILGQQSAS
jgi:hypothetical protein